MSKPRFSPDAFTTADPLEVEAEANMHPEYVEFLRKQLADERKHSRDDIVDLVLDAERRQHLSPEQRWDELEDECQRTYGAKRYIKGPDGKMHRFPLTADRKGPSWN